MVERLPHFKAACMVRCKGTRHGERLAAFYERKTCRRYRPCTREFRPGFFSLSIISGMKILGIEGNWGGLFWELARRGKREIPHESIWAARYSKVGGRMNSY